MIRDNKISKNKSFNPNEGIGGFDIGAYELEAIHPTIYNWSRISRFRGPTEPKLINKVSFNCGTYQTSLIIGKDGTMYIGLLNGLLYSLKSDGTQNWKRKFDKALGTPMLGTKETLYIGTRGVFGSVGHRLYAVNNDGDIDWEFNTEKIITTAPGLGSDHSIYFTTQGSKLYSISQEGELKWTFEKKYFWSIPAISENGMIYIGSGDGYLYTLNKQGDELNKIFVGHGQNECEIMISKEGKNFLYAYYDNKGRIISIDNRGNFIWEFIPQNGSVWKAPALSNDGILYVGASSFRLMAINLGGELIWEVKVKGFPTHPPIIDNEGTIYFASYNDINGRGISWIEAFNADGSKRWEYEFEGASTCPVISKDGTIHIILNGFNKETCILYEIADN